MDSIPAKYLKKRQIIIRFVTILVTVGVLILLLLFVLPSGLNSFAETVLGIISLSVLLIPSLYFLLIKPLIAVRDDAVQALNDAHVQIGFLSFIDPLTQLANRRQLLINLERVTSSCIRHKIYGALLLIDLNEFKSVNMLHGIDAGDAVLVEIARRLGSSIRLEDVLCRLVGDKFVVLIDHLDKEKQIAHDKVLLVADKLINSVNVAVEYNGNNLQVSASAGIALIEFDRLDADAIIRKANVALYRVKRSGGGRAIFSDGDGMVAAL